MEIEDETLAIEENGPGLSLSNIPTDENEGYLESTTNTQTSTVCRHNHLIRRLEKPSKSKFCGAVRKRLKIYLDQGMSIDEARYLCPKLSAK